MREWMQNGAELAWIIDPDQRTVTVYRREQDRNNWAIAIQSTAKGLLPVSGWT